MVRHPSRAMASDARRLKDLGDENARRTAAAGRPEARRRGARGAGKGPTTRSLRRAAARDGRCGGHELPARVGRVAWTGRRPQGHRSQDREARARPRLPRGPHADARDRGRAAAHRPPPRGPDARARGHRDAREAAAALPGEGPAVGRRRGRKRATGTREPMPVPAAPGPSAGRSTPSRTPSAPERRLARHGPRTDGGPRLAVDLRRAGRARARRRGQAPRRARHDRLGRRQRAEEARGPAPAG